MTSSEIYNSMVYSSSIVVSVYTNHNERPSYFFFCGVNGMKIDETRKADWRINDQSNA